MINWIRKSATAIGIARLMKKAPKPLSYPPDASEQDRKVLDRINGFTMTNLARQMSLIHAVRHVVRQRIPGCFVECGVWRGGSSMAMAMTLAQEGDTSRNLHLFDTFEGMTEPVEFDKSAVDGVLAKDQLQRDSSRKGEIWAVATLEDVQQNLSLVGYPNGQLHFVKGPVEATIPTKSPEEPIALLRLDTDWYESTRHELIHLFPKLSPGAIMIIDDYGHWAGARKAVDEYFSAMDRKFFLHRIDYSGRLLVNV